MTSETRDKLLDAETQEIIEREMFYAPRMNRLSILKGLLIGAALWSLLWLIKVAVRVL